MRRFASLLALLALFMPGLTKPVQAASPEDIQKLLGYMANKAAGERVLGYYSDSSGRVVRAAFVHEGRTYVLSYYPYAQGTENTELPPEKRQFGIISKDDAPGWENAVMVLDTGLSGTQVMYVDMIYDSKIGQVRSRGTSLSEEEKQGRYDKMLMDSLAFYEQK